VNAALIIAETAICVMAIEPATRAYLAVSKDRAARAKARREAAPARFTTLGELFPPPVPQAPGPAADTAPAGPVLNGAPETALPPHVVRTPSGLKDARSGMAVRADGSNMAVRADGSNKLLDQLRSGAS